MVNVQMRYVFSHRLYLSALMTRLLGPATNHRAFKKLHAARNKTFINFQDLLNFCIVKMYFFKECLLTILSLWLCKSYFADITDQFPKFAVYVRSHMRFHQVQKSGRNIKSPKKSHLSYPFFFYDFQRIISPRAQSCLTLPRNAHIPDTPSSKFRPEKPY